jgi:hypothetical protein
VELAAAKREEIPGGNILFTLELKNTGDSKPEFALSGWNV